MPALAPKAIPAFLEHVSRWLPSSAPPPAAALVPLLAATALGHSATWLKPCLAHALSPHPPLPPGAPAPPQPPQGNPLLDAATHPRRLVVAQLKEALTKSASLIGVPRVICALLDLDDALDDPRDRATAFVRRGLEHGTVEQKRAAGRNGLESVYKGELEGIFGMMRDRGLDDLRYLSETTTYGTFLTPFASSHPTPPSASRPPTPDPLAHDPRLLSLVTLPCLVAQRSHRETAWHLRGAIRRGWDRDDVEKVQCAIEAVCEACGVEGVGEGMPRVADVEVQEEERLRGA